MPDRSIGTSAVAYGVERMNYEVSHWMRGLSEDDTSPNFPFIATKGFDSVVWNRLYSRDMLGLEGYQINRVCILWWCVFLSLSCEGIRQLKIIWNETNLLPLKTTTTVYQSMHLSANLICFRLDYFVFEARRNQPLSKWDFLMSCFFSHDFYSIIGVKLELCNLNTVVTSLASGTKNCMLIRYNPFLKRRCNCLELRQWW